MARTAPADRAYGRKHRTIRRELITQLRALGAAICPRCGRIMTADMALQLGHTFAQDKQDGKPGDRLEHARCNMSAGGKIGIRYAQAARAVRRSARTTITAGNHSRDW